MRIFDRRYMWVLILLSSCCAETSAKDERYYCNGQCDVMRERCSCIKSCKENRNCCTDYEEACTGGISWKDTDCEEKMKCPEGYEDPPPLIILSIDAFRDTYIHRNLTPTISKLASCGVKTPYMRSAYPTKTFPNHYTIATGLYPESHGIISNTIFDHDRIEKFRPGRPTSFSPHWWHGEPIWVTASNQGLKSATYYWPGGEVNNTRYPDYYYKYNRSTPLEERVYQLFDWLDMPKDRRPSLIALYNHVVDTAGHDGGPYGSFINESLIKSDQMVEMIMNGLRDRNLDTCVNFLIVSDHGMASVDCKNDITFLEDYLDLSEVTLDDGAFVRIGKSMNESLWPKFNAVEMKKKLECMEKETHWQAYLKYEYLPKRFHYANNDKIEDVHLVVDDEWWVAGLRDDPDCDAGGHGYDSTYKDMRAYFTAHGSSIKRGYDRKMPFENIELYNLMTELLDLEAAPNNGTFGSLHDILKNPPDIPVKSKDIEPTACVVKDKSNRTFKNLKCGDCQNLEENESNLQIYPDHESVTRYQSVNMPYGKPRIFKKNAKYCILANTNYITTYSYEYKMPMLSSFVLNRKNITKKLTITPCPRQDNRVSVNISAQCSEYNVNSTSLAWTYLFPPTMNMSEAALSSNLVPVYEPFKQIWDFMGQNFQTWSNLYNGITLHVGPIFDYNFDGHADNTEILEKVGEFTDNEDSSSLPIPTHYFIVATKCRHHSKQITIAECAKELNEIEVLSFIIPNYKEAPCHKQHETMDQWIPTALTQHIARIKDVELLTGISFFTDMSMGNSLTQTGHTYTIQMKLLLPDVSQEWLKDFISREGYTLKPSFQTLISQIPLGNTATQAATSVAVFCSYSSTVLSTTLLVGIHVILR